MSRERPGQSRKQSLVVLAVAAIGLTAVTATRCADAAVAPHHATGIKIGEMTQDSAIIWTRLTEAAEANWGGAAWPVHGWDKMRNPEVQLPEGKTMADMFGLK